ncbi:MAG: DUF4139 domain-containing protein [Sphingobacteriaceae bacterium]|jgi:uncharacterized protein (TIGR02231 family)
MKRIFLLNLLLISSLTLFSQENKIVTAEKIQGITVFRNLAEIKSTVNLNLNTGLNTVIIDNLPKSILKNSIQVSADAGIRIVQLTPITDYKRAALQTQAGLKITDSITNYQDQLSTLNIKKYALEQELEILLANKNLSNKTDLAGEIEDLTAIYKSRIPVIKEEIYRIDKKIKSILNTINQLEKTLANMSNTNDYCSLKISLMANENASKNLRLNYLVNDAGWNPIYDLRVANITAPIFIQQKAIVFQNTGIDWEQVKITLSTGNPIDNGILPNLNPLYSDIYSYQRTKSLDMIEKRGVTQMAMAPSVIETENQLANSYEITALTSIASSQENKIIEIKSDTLAALYQYMAVPKLDPHAYLISRIPNWNNLNLLDGNASVYFEDAYVGETFLNTMQFNDTLQVSLGKDPNILVERIKVKEFSSHKLLSGYQTASLNFNIKVLNNKKTAINLTIEDQAPISKNKSIEVKLNSLDGKYDIETGKLTWKLNLNPSEQKVWSFGYELKYPKNKLISGLE